MATVDEAAEEDFLRREKALVEIQENEREKRTRLEAELIGKAREAQAIATARAEAREHKKREEQREMEHRTLVARMVKSEKHAEWLQRQLQRASAQLAQVRSRLATTASERDAALDAAQIAAEDADGLRLELERTRDELLRVNGGYLPPRLLTSYPPPSVGGAAVRGLGGSASGLGGSVLGGSVLGGSMLGSSGGSGFGMPWRTPEGEATDEATAAMPRVLSAHDGAQASLSPNCIPHQESLTPVTIEANCIPHQESLTPVTIEAAQPTPPQPIAPPKTTPPKTTPEGPAYWGVGEAPKTTPPKTAPTLPAAAAGVDSSPEISISAKLIGVAPTPGHRAAPPPPQHRKPPPPPPTQSIRAGSAHDAAGSAAAPPRPPAAPPDLPTTALEPHQVVPTTAPVPPKSVPTTASVEAKPEPAGQATTVVAEGEFSFEDMVRQSGGAAGTMHAPAMGIKRKGAGKRAMVDPLA